MCVKDLVLELESIMDKIEKKYEELKDKRSKIDLLREDLLFLIESGNFNASQGYKYAKALQKIQSERSDITKELCAMQVLSDRLKPSKKVVQDAINKTMKIINKHEELIVSENENRDDILNKIVNILNEDE